MTAAEIATEALETALIHLRAQAQAIRERNWRAAEAHALAVIRSTKLAQVARTLR